LLDDFSELSFLCFSFELEPDLPLFGVADSVADSAVGCGGVADSVADSAVGCGG
jgi:hypothetical protein